MKRKSKLTLTQPSLFAFRLDEKIAAVLTCAPQSTEQIAASVNAPIVETSYTLALMALQGRVRLGLGFTYIAPTKETQ